MLDSWGALLPVTPPRYMLQTRAVRLSTDDDQETMPRRALVPGPVPAAGRRSLVGADLERCIFCQSTAITREGKRYK